MIFSLNEHIQQIIVGIKTQTRRQSDRYSVRRTYGLQLGRGKPSIKEGRIKIVDKSVECRGRLISVEDAIAEGDYTPEEFEALYDKLYPNWKTRYAYKFQFHPRGENGIV